MRIVVSIEELDGIWIAEVSPGMTLSNLLGGKMDTGGIRRKAYPTQELMEQGVITLIRECAEELKDAPSESKGSR